MLSPSERSLRGRLGGLALAASRDPLEYTAAARQAFRDQFLHEVDPDLTLPEPERRRRAEAARKLHYARLALRSARVRSARSRAAQTA